MSTHTLAPPKNANVIVVGAGNIGSHITAHFARCGLVRSLTFIDPDTYEEKNLSSQDIEPRNVGRRKADVQAEAAHRINPKMHVHAIHERVENVPLGLLRSDLIVSCLDSREARRVVNQAAWRLGIPWVDAGVKPDAQIVRVNTYSPGPQVPCIECSWSDADYALLEQIYPCDPANGRAYATNGTSSLGALAASMQAIECQRLLSAEDPATVAAKQIILDASSHTYYANDLSHNPQCRFDHETWTTNVIDDQPDTLPLHALIQRFESDLGHTATGWSLCMEEKPFTQRWSCPKGCGDQTGAITLAHHAPESKKFCPQCHAKLIGAGFFAQDTLCDSDIHDEEARGRSLASLGLRRGDIFALSTAQGDEIHYEISSNSP